jgi:hypothetical protein
MIDICVDQPFNGIGGVKSQRKFSSSNDDAELLASWFPKFVKVVERAYKQSVPRKEVVVAWKKAYAYGAERRERRRLRREGA